MLAATRLIALHKNKGMTVAACLKNRTDYIENPDKTEQGQYVSSYACSALTADEEFICHHSGSLPCRYVGIPAAVVSGLTLNLAF